jgi:hypothetical protein
VFPPELLEALLATNADGAVISLDAFTELQAPYGLSAEQIDALIEAVEQALAHAHSWLHMVAAQPWTSSRRRPASAPSWCVERSPSGA